jgi:geranylgeranyl diphosphate synthase type I
MVNELNEMMATMIPAVEQDMQSLLHLHNSIGPDETDPFYGMMQYHLGWVNAKLHPDNENTGKRIRPVLCLLSCAAAGGDWQKAVPAGAAVELLHNFTLIHDDIQDNSFTRRGRQTVWQLWGMPQAINSGDGMFAVAFLALGNLEARSTPPNVQLDALRRFGKTCLHLTYGQYMDMDFERRKSVTVDEYLEMITGKTAALLGLCAELGAMIAGADPTTIEHYRQFGQDLGLAFQVKDDILGIWGDENKIGKSAASDIITRKKTLPVLFGIAQSQKLRAIYNQPQNGDGDVEQIVSLLDDVGAKQYAHLQAAHYTESALDHLAAARPDPDYLSTLHQLTDMLLRRAY